MRWKGGRKESRTMATDKKLRWRDDGSEKGRDGGSGSEEGELNKTSMKERKNKEQC